MKKFEAGKKYSSFLKGYEITVIFKAENTLKFTSDYDDVIHEVRLHIADDVEFFKFSTSIHDTELFYAHNTI